MASLDMCPKSGRFYANYIGPDGERKVSVTGAAVAFD